jgi:hypothetical protein
VLFLGQVAKDAALSPPVWLESAVILAELASFDWSDQW